MVNDDLQLVEFVLALKISVLMFPYYFSKCLWANLSWCWANLKGEKPGNFLILEI